MEIAIVGKKGGRRSGPAEIALGSPVVERSRHVS